MVKKLEPHERDAIEADVEHEEAAIRERHNTLTGHNPFRRQCGTCSRLSDASKLRCEYCNSLF